MQDEEIQDKETEKQDWDQVNLVGFLDLLLKSDMRQNPERYEAKKYD